MSAMLDGWDMGAAAETPWVPWGEGGHARAKLLAHGDGYSLAVVEADAGYEGTPHEHAYTEFLYVISGRLRNQGRSLSAGDAYVASAGSSHTDFAAEAPSVYVSIFKI